MQGGCGWIGYNDVMKKLHWSWVVASLVISAGLARAADEMSLRVKFTEVDVWDRSAVVSLPGRKDPVLLHYKPGCSTLTEGQEANLVIRGELNSNGDQIVIADNRRCDVDYVVSFNTRYTLTYVLDSNQEALIRDAAGQQYYISYDSRCRALPHYREETVYMYRFGLDLRKNDMLYLPGNDGQCPLQNVRKVENRGKILQPDPEKDRTVPTPVKRVKASPGNGKVFLSWDAATDPNGVRLYYVSASKYPLDTKKYAPKDMPNLTLAQNTRATVEGLKNEETYYFYVIAVDVNGNFGADWSTQATAMPRSTLPLSLSQPIPYVKLEVQVTGETPLFFQLHWNRLRTAVRHTVLLEVDGKREMILYNYSKNTLSVAKHESRRGKKMRLIVRGYDLKGLVEEDTAEFQF